jgi:hypothetical protein
MCTLSWIRESAGYTLCFNRDERRTRAPALPPSTRVLNGVPYLAPTDGDFGGAWIGVNDRGLSLCLLNRYQDAPAEASGARVSRGLLLISLMDGESAEAISDRMGRLDLRRYLPFTMAALDAGHHGGLMLWDGTRLVVEDPVPRGLVATSSGFDQAAAEQTRTAVFESRARTGLGPRELEELHRSHLPDRGALSVCMHRDDAETVSYSRIRVTGRQVELAYTPGAPCLGAKGVELSLPRAPVSAAGQIRG